MKLKVGDYIRVISSPRVHKQIRGLKGGIIEEISPKMLQDQALFGKKEKDVVRKKGSFWARVVLKTPHSDSEGDDEWFINSSSLEKLPQEEVALLKLKE